jgi:hypothetical protein
VNDLPRAVKAAYTSYNGFLHQIVVPMLVERGLAVYIKESRPWGLPGPRVVGITDTGLEARRALHALMSALFHIVEPSRSLNLTPAAMRRIVLALIVEASAGAVFHTMSTAEEGISRPPEDPLSRPPASDLNLVAQALEDFHAWLDMMDAVGRAHSGDSSADGDGD